MGFLCIYHVWGLLSFLNWWVYVFLHYWKFLSHIFSNILLLHSLSHLSFWDSIPCILHCLSMSHIWTYCFFLSFFFLLVIHFIHISVYMSIPISQFITPPPPPPTAFPLWCPYVFSLLLCLNFCSANRFICTIF